MGPLSLPRTMIPPKEKARVPKDSMTLLPCFYFVEVGVGWVGSGWGLCRGLCPRPWHGRSGSVSRSGGAVRCHHSGGVLVSTLSPTAAHRGLLCRHTLFPGADRPLQAGQGGLPVPRPGAIHALRGDQRGAHPAADAAQPGLCCPRCLGASGLVPLWGSGQSQGLGSWWCPAPIRWLCQQPSLPQSHLSQRFLPRSWSGRAWCTACSPG